MRRIAVLDYGVGNLHSLTKALSRSGAHVILERDFARLGNASALVLPGVGAFGAAAALLERHRDRLRLALLDGLACLGICLGMQLLFDDSEEGTGSGLGVFPGRVHRLRAPRVPHMGWNVVAAGEDPLFRGIRNMFGYYANSFVARPLDAGMVIARTEYAGQSFPAAVRSGRTWGVQFHPEKSGDAGLRLLDNFMELVR